MAEPARRCIEEAGFVLGQALENVTCLALNQSGDLPVSVQDIRTAIERSDTENGVLVLTDLLGASPANLVAEALDRLPRHHGDRNQPRHADSCLELP